MSTHKKAREKLLRSIAAGDQRQSMLSTHSLTLYRQYPYSVYDGLHSRIEEALEAEAFGLDDIDQNIDWLCHFLGAQFMLNLVEEELLKDINGLDEGKESSGKKEEERDQSPDKKEGPEEKE